MAGGAARAQLLRGLSQRPGRRTGRARSHMFPGGGRLQECSLRPGLRPTHRDILAPALVDTAALLKLGWWEVPRALWSRFSQGLLQVALDGRWRILKHQPSHRSLWERGQECTTTH